MGKDGNDVCVGGGVVVAGVAAASKRLGQIAPRFCMDDGAKAAPPTQKLSLV
jgi:hypothetical protein